MQYNIEQMINTLQRIVVKYKVFGLFFFFAVIVEDLLCVGKGFYCG